MKKQSKNKKHIQRQDGCSMEDTSFYSATNRVIGLKYYSGTATDYGFARKRLERGRFSWPQEKTQGDRVRLTHEELTLLLGGIDLERTRAKNWYRYEEKT